VLLVTYRAAAAIFDLGISDLWGLDRVVERNILRTDDTSQRDLLRLGIHSDFTLADDHQIAIRQYLRDDRRDAGRQIVCAIGAAAGIASDLAAEAKGRDIVQQWSKARPIVQAFVLCIDGICLRSGGRILVDRDCQRVADVAGFIVGKQGD